jgi:hypothetical protein
VQKFVRYLRYNPNVATKSGGTGTESIATLPPFGSIEENKWFDQISSQWESQKNRFEFTSFGKIQFLPPCTVLSFWDRGGKEGVNFLCVTAVNSPLRQYDMNGDFKCREVKTGFCRKRRAQTGSSGTLIGWKSGQTTYFPLWDWMERAWLWTLVSARVMCMPRTEKFSGRLFSLSLLYLTYYTYPRTVLLTRISLWRSIYRF